MPVTADGSGPGCHFARRLKRQLSARTAHFPERGRRESDLFDATLRAVSRRTLRDNDRPELKLVEFSVAAPGAKTVQLAADFTDWECAPLDLVSFEGGYWSTIVPLPAGTYAYRFLVDGAWHDHRSGGMADLKHAGSLKAYVQIK
jgi:1,4-alpha-glucan branching enzyme